MKLATFITVGLLLSTTGCTIGQIGDAAELTDEVDEELTAGVNGAACIFSPYNCKLRVHGGARVTTSDPDDDTWGVDLGAPILDGNGTVMGTSTKERITFNYGQRRV
jgi:hypothetical protein